MSDTSDSVFYEESQIDPRRLAAELAVLRQFVDSTVQTLEAVSTFLDNLTEQARAIQPMTSGEESPMRDQILTMGQPDVD